MCEKVNKDLRFALRLTTGDRQQLAQLARLEGEVSDSEAVRRAIAARLAELQEKINPATQVSGH